MKENRKALVLAAMDGKEVERVPSGFWFHFLEDEIGADAYENPVLIEKVFAGERNYIENFQPDFVKIMTDGFFHYRSEQVRAAKRAVDLRGLAPLPEDDPWFTRQIDYAKKITSAYGEDVATFYNIFAPATTFRFMQTPWEEGEARLLSFLKEDAGAVKAAFDVIAGDLALLSERLVREAGVTGIYLSVQNLLGEGATQELYADALAPGERKILAAANRVSPYHILHICGYAGHRNDLTWYRDYEVKAVNWAAVVEGVPLEEGQKIFPGKTVIGGFGNLATDLLARGSKEEVQAETRRLLAQAGRRGVILGADCTVPRDLDWKRLEWVREAAR